MYFNLSDDEKYKEFSKFIYKNVGENIKLKTIKMVEEIKTVQVSKNQLKECIGIINRFNIPFEIYDEHPKFKKKKADEVVIQYFVQYPSSDEDQREKIISLAFEFLKRSIITYPYFPKAENLDDNYKSKLANYYSYFIIDQHNLYETQNLLKHFFNIDIQPLYVDVESEIFNVDGLAYFKIIDKTSSLLNKNMQSEISLKLSQSEINHCTYLDKDGDFTLISTINDTKSRVSSVGFRNDLKEIFKSSWEANFARVLNYLEIEWEYERRHFNLEINTDSDSNFYIPDFFLNNNLLIEIKGFWDKKSIKKIELFKEQYLDYKLLIIDSDMYRSLDKLYRNVIPNWEDNIISKTKEKVSVVGLSFGNRKKYVNELVTGQELFLKRDPENFYDKNATLVLNKDNNEIGFISKEWATIYADKLDLGMKFRVTVLEKKTKVVYINIQRTNFDDEILFDFLK